MDSFAAVDNSSSDQNTQPMTVQQQGISIHGQQVEGALKQKIVLEPDKIKAREQELVAPRSFLAPVNVVHGIDTNFIVFGYQQSDVSYDYHYIWPSLTHIGASFVYFREQGNIPYPSAWTGRPSRLKAGGAAQANGTKVIMVLCNMYNLDSATNVEYSVFTNATYRQNLVNNVASLVTTDSYCQGVSFDFEPWISSVAVRDGITAFTQALATTIRAFNPNYELSYYVNSYYSSSQINLAGILPYMNYLIYSCYDWAGSSPHAISDVNSFIPLVNGYLDAGVPPSKMVLALSTYGNDWYGATTYGQSAVKSSPIGIPDGLYNTTLIPRYSGPFTNHYVTGDEAAWYTYKSSTTHTDVWADMEALEYQTRLAKSFPDPDDVNNGRRLRGVAFWSLYCTATGSSYDPIAKAASSKTRYYPQFFQICDEVFSPPGNHNYLIEKFEGPNGDRDYRWRDPSESPDSKGYSSAVSLLTTAPAGTGQPPRSDNAMRITFTFTSTSGNKLFFRHEILNDDTDTGVTDINHAKFYVNRNSKIRAYIYSAGAYTGRQVRMVAMDTAHSGSTTARQLEQSKPFSIATAGWQLMEWDLTDSSQISAYTTAEPAFKTGNGVLDASTTGAKDIGFVGFIIEGGISGSGTVYFDEISYMPTNPGGKNYVINEFTYSNITQEYVEIYGPAGAFPTGMQLRFFNSSDGSVNTTINLTGTITDAGSGYGYWVVGDTGVTNVNQVFANSTGRNIPSTQPGGIQIFNATTGNVYDSVVYQAWGGLGDLIRKQTLGVTQNGYPWLGAVGPGLNGSSKTYTIGRYPDGKDTYVNGSDFSVMPQTPGAANGGSVTPGTNYDFSSTPASLYQSYDTLHITNPTYAGLPASPSGGNAYRCVDTSGGGVEGFIGDAALGQNSTGYTVTGEVYIPASTATTQAIAIGICGRQGSTFFTSTKATEDASGYESGYWLIFENRSGVGMNDGRADHGGTFEFVYAHNDNMDTTKVTLLASTTRTALGISDGAWSTFSFTVNPAMNQLAAQLNSIDVYRGTIPTGGPISGAFQVAFRENHTGNPTSSEGTWVDNITFGAASASPLMQISPTTMSFVTTVGTSSPATKPLQILNYGTPGYSWTAVSNQAWLYIASTSGTVSAYGAQTVQVGVTLGSLTYGAYTGQITLSSSSAMNSPQTLTVIFTVNPPAASLRILPTTMSFTTLQGGSNPATQSLQIFNDGSPSFSWSAATNATWLYITPASGSANAFGAATAQVGVKVGSLTYGTYTGKIIITATGAVYSPQTASITFVVNPQPATLRILPTTMSFTTSQGGSNPATKALQIFDDGLPGFTWSASSNQSWLYLSSTTGTVNTYTAQTIQVGATLGSLSYGTYTGQITVTTSSAANSPQILTVTFVINQPVASLRILPTTMSFTASQGGLNPATKSLQIFNDGSPSFSWSAATNATWLYITPVSGTVNAYGAATVQVGTKVGSLTQGTYTGGQVTITATGILNSPRTLSVTFVVTPEATEVKQLWWLFE
ncbi:MAG: glycosyl hydrolase family 18 protein [bacterium]